MLAYRLRDSLRRFAIEPVIWVGKLQICGIEIERSLAMMATKGPQSVSHSRAPSPVEDAPGVSGSDLRAGVPKKEGLTELKTELQKLQDLQSARKEGQASVSSAASLPPRGKSPERRMSREAEASSSENQASAFSPGQIEAFAKQIEASEKQKAETAVKRPAVVQAAPDVLVDTSDAELTSQAAPHVRVGTSDTESTSQAAPHVVVDMSDQESTSQALSPKTMLREAMGKETEGWISAAWNSQRSVTARKAIAYTTGTLAAGQAAGIAGQMMGVVGGQAGLPFMLGAAAVATQMYPEPAAQAMAGFDSGPHQDRKAALLQKLLTGEHKAKVARAISESEQIITALENLCGADRTKAERAVLLLEGEASLNEKLSDGPHFSAGAFWHDRLDELHPEMSQSDPAPVSLRSNTSIV
jgi:hypothetical protein